MTSRKSIFVVAGVGDEGEVRALDFCPGGGGGRGSQGGEEEQQDCNVSEHGFVGRF